MTHQGDSTAYAAVMEALIENGFEGMAAAMEVLLNVDKAKDIIDPKR